jgi:hypothetical protein
MREHSMGRWRVWLAGLAALLVAVIVLGVLIRSSFGSDNPRVSPSPVGDAPSISSERATATVKEWIAGGTEAAYVHDLLDSLVCDGYYRATGTWEVMCRLPWIPVEGYFFSLSEVSWEVEPETETTLAFVRLLRQWGHVSEP